jgi:hypothetical protein
MYLADHARLTPDKPALISADTGKVVTFEEVRRVAAVHLFEAESRLKPDQKDVLTQEWARLFS